MVTPGVTCTKRCMKFLAPAYSTFCTGNNTSAFFFPPVFHSFEEACTTLLLITQYLKLQVTDTNPSGFIFSGLLNLAHLDGLFSMYSNCGLIMLHSNWKCLISYSKEQHETMAPPFFLLFFHHSKGWNFSQVRGKAPRYNSPHPASAALRTVSPRCSTWASLDSPQAPQEPSTHGLTEGKRWPPAEASRSPS